MLSNQTILGLKCKESWEISRQDVVLKSDYFRTF